MFQTALFLARQAKIRRLEKKMQRITARRRRLSDKAMRLQSKLDREVARVAVMRRNVLRYEPGKIGLED